MEELLKALEDLHTSTGVIFADIDLDRLTDHIQIKERTLA